MNVKPVYGVVLYGLPMPPSVNALFRDRYDRSGNRMPGRAKSREYIEFIKKVQEWRLKNLSQANHARLMMEGAAQDQVFEIHMDFYFPREDLVTKDNRPKRNDTSNRIKALEDAISEHILGVDDKVFWSGAYAKLPTRGLDVPYVNVTIVVMDERLTNT